MTGDLTSTDRDDADLDDSCSTTVVTQGQHGTLTLNAQAMELRAEQQRSCVQALKAGDPLTDTITVETSDGTQQ